MGGPEWGLELQQPILTFFFKTKLYTLLPGVRALFLIEKCRTGFRDERREGRSYRGKKIQRGSNFHERIHIQIQPLYELSFQRSH